MVQFGEALSAEAALEADALFPPERLRALQEHIARRLDQAGHPARVISFPARASSHLASRAVPRLARRWIAGSVAAGLFIGVGTGLFLDWGATRATMRRQAAIPRQILRASRPGVEGARAEILEADDVFLSELALAGERPRIRALSAVDALTPHVREITLR